MKITAITKHTYEITLAEHQYKDLLLYANLKNLQVSSVIFNLMIQLIDTVSDNLPKTNGV